MEDVLREPVALIDEDLDEVAGGTQNFWISSTINNQDSNQGLQIGVAVNNDFDVAFFNYSS